MDYKTADRLIELRKQKGLSQDDLAEQLDISRQAISKWERAESLPDTENLIKLAKLYNITIDELIYGTGMATEPKPAEQAIAIPQQPPVNMKNKILLSFVVAMVGFVVALVGLGLVGYFIAELIEVLGGYYSHMGEAYVRSEIIGYSVGIALCTILTILGTIAGIRNYLNYRKASKEQRNQ